MTWELGLGLLALAGLAFGARERSRAGAAEQAMTQAQAASRAAEEARAAAEEALRRRGAEEALARASQTQAEAQLRELEQTLSEAVRRAQSAEAEAQALGVAVAQKDAAQQELARTLDARSVELDTVRRDRVTLAQARHALSEELTQAEAKLSERGQELARRRRDLVRAETERARLAHEVEQLHEQLAGHQTLTAAHASMETELEELRAELERLRATPPSGSSRAVMRRMQELSKELDGLREQVSWWSQRAQEAEAELERRDADATGDGPLVAERDALRARVEALEDSLRRVAANRAALRALGVPAAAPNADFFALERREGSEATLRDTYLAAGAAAAGVFDDRGVAWARCGNTTPLERLAASAVLLPAPAVEAALGRPAQLMSETFGAYGRHLARLGDTDKVLALTGSRECPALALRLAALRLAGDAPLTAHDLDDADVLDLHPERSDRLGAWALRRGALSAAVFGDDEPAGTDSVFAGHCAPLVEVVLALHQRASRDGFAAGFAVLWRGEDDVTLAARALDDGRTVAFAKFNAPPAPRVLDDLLATTRWLGAAAAS